MAELGFLADRREKKAGSLGEIIFQIFLYYIQMAHIRSITQDHINNITELKKGIDIIEDGEFVNINYKCGNLKKYLTL
jgi:hypothetical protein